MPRLKRDWLFVPFKAKTFATKDSVARLAKEWCDIANGCGKRFGLCDIFCRLDDVQDNDDIYLLGHGNIGCQELAFDTNTPPTELITPQEAADRLYQLLGGRHIDSNFALKIYSCSAGDEGSSREYSFANRCDVLLRDKYYRQYGRHSRFKTYAYTQSVTIPEWDRKFPIWDPKGHLGRLVIGDDEKPIRDAEGKYKHPKSFRKLIGGY